MATWILIFCSVCSSLSFIRARTHLLRMDDQMCVLRGSTCLEPAVLRGHGQLAELRNKNLQVSMYCFSMIRSDAHLFLPNTVYIYFLVSPGVVQHFLVKMSFCNRFQPTFFMSASFFKVVKLWLELCHKCTSFVMIWAKPCQCQAWGGFQRHTIAWQPSSDQL